MTREPKGFWPETAPGTAMQSLCVPRVTQFRRDQLLLTFGHALVLSATIRLERRTAYSDGTNSHSQLLWPTFGEAKAASGPLLPPIRPGWNQDANRWNAFSAQ
jgi:hypothetical protein